MLAGGVVHGAVILRSRQRAPAHGERHVAERGREHHFPTAQARGHRGFIKTMLARCEIARVLRGRRAGIAQRRHRDRLARADAAAFQGITHRRGAVRIAHPDIISARLQRTAHRNDHAAPAPGIAGIRFAVGEVALLRPLKPLRPCRKIAGRTIIPAAAAHGCRQRPAAHHHTGIAGRDVRQLQLPAQQPRRGGHVHAEPAVLAVRLIRDRGAAAVEGHRRCGNLARVQRECAQRRRVEIDARIPHIRLVPRTIQPARRAGGIQIRPRSLGAAAAIIPPAWQRIAANRDLRARHMAAEFQLPAQLAEL